VAVIAEAAEAAEVAEAAEAGGVHAEVSLSRQPSWPSAVSLSSVYTRDPNRQALAAEYSAKGESVEVEKKMLRNPFTSRRAVGIGKRNAEMRNSIHTVTALNAMWSKLLK